MRARSSRTSSATGRLPVQPPSLDYAQLRALFVLVAHHPTTGATASYLATTLRLDRMAVADVLERMAEAGLLQPSWGRSGGRHYVGTKYKLVTLIRGFNQGQAGAFFEATWPRP